MNIVPTHGALIDNSDDITVGGTAQTVESAGRARKYFLFQNISDTTMWINFGVTAVADKPSIQVVAGASLMFDGSFVPTGSVSLMCATTGKKFVCKEA